MANGLRGIKRSRDRRRHVTPKGQLVTQICLERNISEQLGMLFGNNCQLLYSLL